MMKFIIVLVAAISLVGFMENPAHAGEHYKQGDIWCLSEAVFFEARGESKAGQVAVMDVILNRVADKRWPNTICKVTNQKSGNVCQFEFACLYTQKKRLDMIDKEYGVWKKLNTMVQKTLKSNRKTDANHFATLKTNSKWMKRMQSRGVIGNHKFFRG